MSTSTEARHPIGVVADRTGLTPDVLRVWERRYRVVEPKRSAGGQRLYSDADVERLTLLHRATRGGHGISHVASLSKARLEDLVSEVEGSGNGSPLPLHEETAHPLVEQALTFTEALDPAGLESLLRRSVARYGIISFLDTIAAPFLRAVGDAWHDGKLSVSQEHLASAVIQRVVSETAPLLTGTSESPVIVIATLEGERHANGALMAAATAASEGWRVIYLGADLPTSEIVETARRTRARAVGISVVVPDKRNRIEAEIRALENGLHAPAQLVIGGSGAKRLGNAQWERTLFVETMAELHALLGGISGQGAS
jgi:methanogenic corrinoid protein MtbC1